MEQFDLTQAAWRTSSYSGGNGNCVQVASGAQLVALRDSKNPTGGTLRVPAAHWPTFLNAIKHNDRNA